MHTSVWVSNRARSDGCPDEIESMWISFIRNCDHTYIEDNGYTRIHPCDFTGRPSNDPAPPIHPDLPDGEINIWDVIYFADTYVGLEGVICPKDLHPYLDIDYDLVTDIFDVIAFAECYICAQTGAPPCEPC